MSTHLREKRPFYIRPNKLGVNSGGAGAGDGSGSIIISECQTHRHHSMVEINEWHSILYKRGGYMDGCYLLHTIYYIRGEGSHVEKEKGRGARA